MCTFQSGRIDLQQQKLRVDTVLSGVVEFENNQEDVSVAKFYTDIEALKQAVDKLSHRWVEWCADNWPADKNKVKSKNTISSADRHRCKHLVNFLYLVCKM